MSHILLDEGMIAELRELMGDEFGTLVKTFAHDSEQRLRLIQQSLQAQDGDALRKAAHSFKGSCSNLGASALAEQLRRLEERAVAADWQACSSLVAGIVDGYKEVHTALAALVP